MLRDLWLENIVVIKEQKISFEKGLTVFTGETGAGKSILLDGLGFVLGARSDKALVRQGEEQLKVVALFDMSQGQHDEEILDKYDIDPLENIFIQRTLSDQGKGKASVNKVPVNIQTLKEIGRSFVEIHSQFEMQDLLNVQSYLQILDSFGNLGHLKDICKNAFEDYKKTFDQWQEQGKKIDQWAHEKDYIEFQLQDLEKLSPQEGEYLRLCDRQKVLSHGQKIREKLQNAYDHLNPEETSPLIVLRRAQKDIEEIAPYNDSFRNVIEFLDQASIHIAEVVAFLEHSLNGLEGDPHELQELEERIYAYKTQARKHKVAPEDLMNFQEDLKTKLTEASICLVSMDVLEQQVQDKHEHYMTIAKNLRSERLAASSHLAQAVETALKDLCFHTMRFQIIFKEVSESSQGMDAIDFFIQTNPGTAFGPLNKIASGGELSRIMLALKTVLAKFLSCQTLVFDEIDMGVGGATATAIAVCLKKLSQEKQVLIITHSPQVAAYGDWHFKVEKIVYDNLTVTNVCPLTQEQREEEIGRMLSGKELTPQAKNAAKALLFQGR